MRLYSPDIIKDRGHPDYQGDETISFYNTILEVRDGEIETSNDNAIQFLLSMGFVPFQELTTERKKGEAICDICGKTFANRGLFGLHKKYNQCS